MAERLIRVYDQTHFRGVNIRCEHARAFRTLLVSFRVPPSYMGQRSTNILPDKLESRPQMTDIIPSSMRARRPKSVRYAA